MRSPGGTRKRGTRLSYPEVRDNIRDGDIVLFRGKSWVSRLIRWGTRSPYSHSGILAWWSGRLMVLEAVPAGVLVSRLSKVVERYSGNVELWTAHEAHADKLCRVTALSTAQRLIGKGYSRSKLFWNLYRLLRGQGGAVDRDPEGDPVAFVCSEYVSRVWREAGIDLADDLVDMYTKPSDIATSTRLRRVGELHRGEITDDAADSLPRGKRSAG